MSFVCAIIVVGRYFNRKRAIATGIAMSGSGFGTFAYAHLTDFLLQHYDWRGTILILTGVLLNGVVCGLLFRPISEYYSHSSRVIPDNIPASIDPMNEAELEDVFYTGSPAIFRRRRHSVSDTSHDLPSSSLPKSYVYNLQIM